MKFKRLAFTSLAMISLASLLFAGTVAAQSYPQKPITMVVPFPAGGPTDTVARTLALVMSKSLGQPVILENAGGAGGTIGVGKVVSAPNDGYTILLMHIGIATAPSLYRTLKYDVTRDLEPIGLVTEVPMTLIARNDFPAKDFKELVAYVKANKAKVSFGNAGIGSASHLCGMLFMSAIETDLLTINYKGTAPAMTDLLGGQIDFMCDQSSNATPQIRGGKVRAYGVTSLARVASLPDLPTLNEAGLKGFNVGVWYGMWTPKDTPKIINDKLVMALQAAMKDESVRARLADLGASPEPLNRQNPDALRTHLVSEIAKWGPVIRKAGIYAD